MHIHEIGESIRKIRKERGLRLEDLADKNISPATISNIERGVPHVNMEKAKYLLSKMGLEMSDLPDLIVDDQQELQNFEFELFTIETLQGIGKTDQALERLEQLEWDDEHPLAATVYYLKGKCYSSRKQWKQAEKSFHHAVRLSKKDPENNIGAASYSELGICRYQQNDLHQAVYYTDLGIQAYRESGERPQFKYILKKNKAVYLERLGRLTESLKEVQGVWENLTQIKQAEVVLGFYWLHSELLRKNGLTDESIQIAREGLELARLNHQYFIMFDLWTVLGSAYMNQKNWNKAESCFQMALQLDGLFSEGKVFTTTYARLGLLHMVRKEWDSAGIMIEKAVQNGEQHNDAPRLTFALLVQGDFYRARYRWEDAIDAYEQALQLAQHHHYKKKEYQALFRLAECWENVNEREFQKCMKSMYRVQQELQNEEEDIREEATI
ncbi:helix-turn-helix domain-containing protein [Paludifilum halophilum]|uniref:helix-turn-helix domain-containing protein n=1 Tax=Paludifilum halophilum TaxID=1642702 RepID=UPI001F0AF823|nr:helix-turn-helix domain-containing protein [Paludifilum halophilum]